MLSRFLIDFEANKSRDAKMIMFTYRLGNYIYCDCKNKIARLLLSLVYKLLRLWFIKIIAGADIPPACKIGKGFWLTHGAKGVIIHKDAVIGDNVRVFHQVTIGANDPRKPTGYGVPVIGNNVFIGAGAKIIGPVTIGDNAIIGANAVVVRDVPANHTAVGIPAKVKRIDKQVDELLCV